MTPTFTATIFYARVNAQERAGNLAQSLEEHGIRAGVVFDPDVGDLVEFSGQGAPTPKSFEETTSFLATFDQPSAGGVVLKFVTLPHGEGLPLPAYETPGSAAMDLRAAISDDITMLPGERKIVPTGLTFALPPGFEAQVRGRSGLAAKHGVGLVNGVGTIDSDFRGEIGVILINHGQEAFHIRRGDRIAQLLIAPVVQARWQAVESLDDTSRGTGGYGSTGR
jgi:dUTP pyrophosphatase